MSIVMKRLSLLVCVPVLAAAVWFPQKSVPSWEISGIVVDERGAPLAGAEFARYFLLTGGKFTAYEGLKADAQGRFAGKITPYKLPMTYIALDKDGKLGACIVVTEQSVKSAVRVVLKPLAELSYRTEIEGGYAPVSMNTSIGCPDTNTVVVLSYDSPPLKVPEGTYELQFFSIELQKFRKPFSVSAGQKVDVGVCSPQLTPISRNIGNPAMPVEFAEARGVPPDFKLADLKGKWVLLEFWGFW